MRLKTRVPVIMLGHSYKSYFSGFALNLCDYFLVERWAKFLEAIQQGVPAGG